MFKILLVTGKSLPVFFLLKFQLLSSGTFLAGAEVLDEEDNDWVLPSGRNKSLVKGKMNFLIVIRDKYFLH